jgi:hypothetical protein
MVNAESYVCRPSRRRLLGLTAAAAAMPLIGSPLLGRALAAVPHDVLFRALRAGSQVGEHRINFHRDDSRLVVETHIDIAITLLMFTVFQFRHQSVEIWDSNRLLSIDSTTDDDGTPLRVSGSAVAEGFRIVGSDGPFLAATTLMTSNTLWDRRIVLEHRLLDAQRGSEIGLIARQRGDELVDTRRGPTGRELLSDDYPPLHRPHVLRRRRPLD